MTLCLVGPKDTQCFGLVGWLMSLLVIACGGRSAHLADDGQGGKGATDPTACSMPIEQGPCEAAIRSYAFDVATRLCLPFYYGGCEGNANRFDTAEDCYRACDAPEMPDLAECAQSGECLAISTDCCPCGDSRWDNVIGVNHSTDANAFRARCGPIACDDCALGSDLAWFGSTCREGHCVAYDARETEITECSPTSGCQLRYGLGCCMGCASDMLPPIAVNADGRGDEIMCPEGHHPCPPCAVPGPQLPPNASAVCTDGRCDVAWR